MGWLLSAWSLNAQEAPAEAESEGISPIIGTWYEETVGRLIPEKWSGEMRFGYHFTRTTNRRNEIITGLRAERQAGPHGILLKGFYEYGRERDAERNVSKVLDKWGGSLGYRYNIQPRWFLESEAGYLSNRVQEIDHQVDLSGRVGYRVLTGERLGLTLAPGPTLRYLDAQGKDPDWFVLAGLRQDAYYHWSDDLRFTQAFIGSVRPDETDDYSIRFESSLALRLSKWTEVALTYSNEYNTFINDTGERREERLVVSIRLPF
jgi:putative salt-induced outer membrane protein YdiY